MAPRNREKSDALKAQWLMEKETVQAGRKVKEEIDKLRTELEQAQRKGDFARAGEIQYGLIPERERELISTIALQSNTFHVSDALLCHQQQKPSQNSSEKLQQESALASSILDVAVFFHKICSGTFSKSDLISI